MANNHQCLPALHGERVLPMVSSGCAWVKETNNSLQVMIYSILDTKGVTGLPMMKRNTASMKNTQIIHRYRLNCNKNIVLRTNPEMQEQARYR